MKRSSCYMACLLVAAASLSAISDRPLREIHCELRPIEWEEVHQTRSNDAEGSLESIQVGATAVTTPTVTKANNYIWSGYAAIKPLGAKPITDGRATGVSGSWTVPTLLPSTNNAFVSVWVGIDGYLTSTVEQIGTTHKWKNGKQENFAWFELYPAYLHQIVGFPVEAGDEISAEVTYPSHLTFQMEITNHTKGVTTVVPLASTRVSSPTTRRGVEWIVEAPYGGSVGKTKPIANFQTVTFRNCTATIDGVTATIVNPAWSTTALTMVDNGVVNMVPSALSVDGSSFQVTWKKE